MKICIKWIYEFLTIYLNFNKCLDEQGVIYFSWRLKYFSPLEHTSKVLFCQQKRGSVDMAEMPKHSLIDGVVGSIIVFYIFAHVNVIRSLGWEQECKFAAQNRVITLSTIFLKWRIFFHLCINMLDQHVRVNANNPEVFILPKVHTSHITHYHLHMEIVTSIDFFQNHPSCENYLVRLCLYTKPIPLYC